MKGNIEMAKTLTLHRTGIQQVWQEARMRKLILPLVLFLVFLVGMALMCGTYLALNYFQLFR